MVDNPSGAGYRQPPKHSQFKPGQSGNPRGRPKGARGLKTDLAQELSASLTIQINGQPVKATKQQLMLKTLATRAASGDVKAAAVLLPLILQILGFEDRGSEKQRLSATDQSLLDQLIGELGDTATIEPSDDPGTTTETPGASIAKADPDDQ